MKERNYNSLAPSAKTREDWMNTKWRPMMGWMYMAVCIADFMVFPVLWSVIQVMSGSGVGEVKDQWDPLTLQGAGLFHVAMGVVLGLTTWGRTQEKINGVHLYPGSDMQPSGATVMTTYGNHSVDEPVYDNKEEEVPPRTAVRPPIRKPD